MCNSVDECMILTALLQYYKLHHVYKYTACLRTNVGHFYSSVTSAKVIIIIIIFFCTVKYRKDLQRKLELQVTPLLTPVAARPCEM